MLGASIAMGDDEPIESAPTPEDLAAPRRLDTRALPARFHHLRRCGITGAHALHAFAVSGGDDSLAKRLGSGTHALLLGKPTVLFDQPSKASLDRQEKARKEGKPPPKLTPAPRSGEEWARFAAANQGKIIMTKPELAAAERMANAIRGNADAARILFGTGAARDMVFERSIVWAELGRSRQSTPDARAANGEVNVEIKTTRCASPLPWLFPRDVQRMAYHAQLADQNAAIAYETGRRPIATYIIAVESAEPHVVQVYRVRDAELEEGEQLRTKWLERLQMFEATQLWGGYAPGIIDLEFPPRDSGIVVADPDWLSDEPLAGKEQSA
jgi:hypothetical protein